MTGTRVSLTLLATLVSATAVLAQTTAFPSDRVLTHREQAPLVKSWIQKRFETVLPPLMRREKIDMWIIVSREYNDDPVFRSMAPLTTYSSRRRTILVFHDRNGSVERLSIGRFDYDGLFKVVPTANDEQMAGLRKLVDPVGYHGHAAGSPIGMTDCQTGVPVRGDYGLRPDTWHSIELNVQHTVPEWGGQTVTFALEEDAALTANGWDWIDGRQTQFYLIK